MNFKQSQDNCKDSEENQEWKDLRWWTEIKKSGEKGRKRSEEQKDLN